MAESTPDQIQEVLVAYYALGFRILLMGLGTCLLLSMVTFVGFVASHLPARQRVRPAPVAPEGAGPAGSPPSSK